MENNKIENNSQQADHQVSSSRDTGIQQKVWQESQGEYDVKRVSPLSVILKVFMSIFTMVLFLVLLAFTFFLGYTMGFNEGQTDSQGYYGKLASEWLKAIRQTKTPTVIEVPADTPQQEIETTYARNVDWGGPELWDVVNARRVQLGVNKLESKADLCTIASIRLNELLELGKLDGHEGFSNMSETRPDLEYVFENYSTVAEFLAAGGSSPEETVEMWENTMGHNQLMTGGEYVWGCVYAQNSFAVAIAAY